MGEELRPGYGFSRSSGEWVVDQLFSTLIAMDAGRRYCTTRTSTFFPGRGVRYESWSSMTSASET